MYLALALNMTTYLALAQNMNRGQCGFDCYLNSTLLVALAITWIWLGAIFSPATDNVACWLTWTVFMPDISSINQAWYWGWCDESSRARLLFFWCISVIKSNAKTMLGRNATFFIYYFPSIFPLYLFQPWFTK